MSKLLPQAEPVDCEACFLKTLHTSDQWTLWKSFVGFRCRIEVNFAILFTSKEIFPRRDSAAPRGPTRGGSGRAPAGFFGLRTKGFSWDAGRRESRHQERDSGFVPIRAGGRLAGLYAEPTAAGAADSGGQLRALLIRVVR